MLRAVGELHKFGGTSLANAERFQAVQQLLSGQHEVIVVSAVKGVTNQLVELLQLAREQQDYLSLCENLKKQHEQLANELCSKNAKSFHQIIQRDLQEIKDLLHAVTLVGTFDPVIFDRIVGYGEQWSGQLLAVYLNQFHSVTYLNTTTVIYTKVKHGIQEVDWQRSQEALEAYWQQHQLDQYDQIVATGFIVAAEDGRPTTLGRNGSDFSAAILGKLLNVKSIIIWTDVDGILSADPAKVPSAFVLKSTSYQEALELAYFGAKVLHPRAIEPVVDKAIPIYIKNSLAPSHEGTCVSANPEPSPFLIRGLSSIDQVALLNVEGPGMVGISGIVSRLFHELSRVNISIILISQASSEHSICFAVQSEEADQAQTVLQEYFKYELREGVISRIHCDKNCAILAAVGENMIGQPGITARLGRALAKANVSIRAIAQGSSERNISIVVKQSDISRALRAVHSGFYLSNKTVSVGLIGPGLVGLTLLQQIHATIDLLANEYQTSFVVRGIANSRKMLLTEHSVDPVNIKDQLEREGAELNLNAFVAHVVSEDIPHAVIIDCTASKDITKHYIEFIKCGANIVTPNKNANSGDLILYRELKKMCQKNQRQYFYETTVCAGLPVIKTLQDLIQTGDEILSIEGVVSGTLAYIFAHLGQGKTFSEVVLEAKKLGYTEPDPRDDLSGLDVAKKFVCLAREIGLSATLDQVTLQSLVPEGLRDCDKETFLKKLPQYDNEMEEKMQKIATATGQLHYAGLIKADGTIEVSVRSYASDHPFAHILGTNNMIVFRTGRYNKQPMIIQGPGAGASVTAAGVFADLMRLVSTLAE